MPAPFVFLVVVTATVVLIIFFGAWAVSAESEGRSLNFGLTGTTLEDFGVAPIGETSEGVADSWWGKGFLKACPLH
jgi:hypothetical protein